MDKEELKRCPFCGSEAKLSTEYSKKTIKCSNEDCIAYLIFNQDDDITANGLINKWNTRPQISDEEIENAVLINTAFITQLMLINVGGVE